MKKKIILITLIIFVILTLIISTSIELSQGWSYVKFNNKIYVVNSEPSTKINNIGSQIGIINSKTFFNLKPSDNNSSNKFPYGTVIYESPEKNTIIVDFSKPNEPLFYKLEDVDTIENLKNQTKIKVK